MFADNPPGDRMCPLTERDPVLSSPCYLHPLPQTWGEAIAGRSKLPATPPLPDTSHPVSPCPGLMEDRPGLLERCRLAISLTSPPHPQQGLMVGEERSVSGQQYTHLPANPPSPSHLPLNRGRPSPFLQCGPFLGQHCPRKGGRQSSATANFCNYSKFLHPL
jgi:hypothetical protein